MSLLHGVDLLSAYADHFEKIELRANGLSEVGVFEQRSPKMIWSQRFHILFDRSDDYEALFSAIAELRAEILRDSVIEVMKKYATCLNTILAVSIWLLPNRPGRIDRPLQGLRPMPVGFYRLKNYELLLALSIFSNVAIIWAGSGHYVVGPGAL